MADTESLVDILYVDTFNQMGINKSHLLPCRGSLIGFTNHSLLPEGMITLPSTIREHPRQTTIQVQFLVIDLKSAHIIILSRTVLHLLRAIPSTYHQMVKFSTPNGVGVAKSNQQEARSYYLLSTKGKGAQDSMPIELACLQLEKTMEQQRTIPMEELKEIHID
ncbi:uncharacterized protein LOC109846045 [Asparagus officinalis]|uniref:uncharacterized protein LOC109846045 n=1 Tax=Asparagus officinalis TaxID=4686 RepID=UPI00098E15D5|nr:uncharacterized protein LOC109846045 [Asparagus officinalis]